MGGGSEVMSPLPPPLRIIPPLPASCLCCGLGCHRRSLTHTLAWPCVWLLQSDPVQAFL